MKKKSLLPALALAFTLTLSLTACGGSSASSSAPAPSSSPAADPASSAGTASGADAPSEAAELITLKVGASPAPHQQILEALVPELEKEGVKLEIVPFTDYIMPNTALDAGDIDANYFQHFPYLEDFNAKNSTDLVSAVAVHFEPLGIYPGKSASLDSIPDKAAIAVPNDPTNEARALLLLEKLGLIKLKEGVGLEATKLDIVENPKGIDIQEIEAAQVTRVLPDVDFAVINGNYAIDAGIGDTMLASEDAASEASKEFANIIAVRSGDESRPEIQALVKVLTSDACKQFINGTYNGAVLPVF